MEIFNPRVGALLQSYSTRPEVAAQGARMLQDMDAKKELEEQSKLKAEEAKRSVFGTLLATALKNPDVDDDTLSKLAQGAGIDSSGISLGSIVQRKDPREARIKSIPSGLASKLDPASIDAFAESGNYRDLVVRDEPQKGVTLSPQSRLVDPVTGDVLAENTNVRPTNTGYKQQVLKDVLQRGESLRAEKGGSEKLSDRLSIAIQKIDENVAKTLSTPSTGDKMKEKLDAHRTSLVKYDNAAEHVMRIIEKDPTAVTRAGGIASGIQSMAASAQGVLNLFGADIEDLDLGETEWADKLNDIAGDNAELRTVMFNLAIQLAVADGLANGRMTNQQIEMALDNIGAAGRSPMAVKRKVKEVRARVAEALDIALDGALEDFSDLDRADPTAGPSTPPPPDASAEELLQYYGGGNAQP